MVKLAQEKKVVHVTSAKDTIYKREYFFNSVFIQCKMY